MHFFLLSSCLIFWAVLLPASGQLILHSKEQITRHHRHYHHSRHAPSPPEWVQALQKSQQPLNVMETVTAAPQARTDVPGVPGPKMATKMPEMPSPQTDFRKSDILNTSPITKNSDVLVSISFTSIPRWPKNGEQIDFLTVPLGKWTRPGMIRASNSLV